MILYLNFVIRITFHVQTLILDLVLPSMSISSRDHFRLLPLIKTPDYQALKRKSIPSGHYKTIALTILLYSLGSSDNFFSLYFSPHLFCLGREVLEPLQPISFDSVGGLFFSSSFLLEP